MLRSFRKLNTDSRELNQVQENIEQTFRAVLVAELLGGQLLTDVQLASGANRVQHGLSQPLQGYFVVRKNGIADIYDTKSSKVVDRNILILNSTASVTVDLWVF